MVNHVSTKFVGPVAGIKEAGIPLNPVAEDYERTQFWKQGPWQELRNKSRTTDREAAIYSIFMEDQFGEPIPDGVRRALRDDANKFWTDMLQNNQIPTKYSAAGFKTCEDFRIEMEGKYPWLRLCEGHWKVKQVWRNCLNGWKKNHMPGGAPSTDLEKLKNRVVIEIPSSDGDNMPTGSKRGREDEIEAGPSKKPKGQEHVTQPTSRRPQPKMKKPSARHMNVRLSIPLLPLDICLLRNA